MCEVSEKIRQWGREEGREQGRAEGREEGREQGREQGREEGREQGQEEAKLETAQRMLSLGNFSHEQIAQIVDLPVETVRELARKKVVSGVE